MKDGGYRRIQLKAVEDDAGFLGGSVILESHYPDSPVREKKTYVSPGSVARPDEISHWRNRYCDQRSPWGTRVFGLAGTSLVIVIVATAALFTWKAVVRPVKSTSQPLTVMALQPIATPPIPVRNLPPGPEQVEKHESDLVSIAEPVPTPLLQLSKADASARDTREPVNITDPGPAVPETTAPKSIAAPTANRLSNDARANWESTILAHLERFRRYPARARAARRQGTAYVRFRMNRTGGVLSFVIVKKSGSFDLDQAALDTLKRAQPLPDIPADMPDEVELVVPVEYYLAR